MKTQLVMLAVVLASFALPVLDLRESTPEIRRDVLTRLDGLGPIVQDPPGTYRLALDFRRLDDGVLVGWEATHLGIKFLEAAIEESDFGEKQLRQLAEVTWMNLANLLYLACLVTAMRNRWWRSFAFGALGAGSAAWWLYELDLAAHLRVGYWLWLGGLGAAAVISLACALTTDRWAAASVNDPATGDGY